MKKILIIDDQHDNALILYERLTREGFRVHIEYNGKDGISYANAENPDLILLDIMMPDMNGLEVCRHLKNNPRTAFIPIILVTAKNSPQDTEEGFKAGAFDYIKKPFDKLELFARVKSAIRHRETQELLLEAEKVSTYMATVVTTNHKIKQPLTLINLAGTAIKRELTKEEIIRENIAKKLETIEAAVLDIKDVLEQLNRIEKPRISEYVRDIKMIDLEPDDQEE
ncbi:MAG: response regulator [Ignavibacteriaceae bacterium]|nr:response regulator [Ignavibacteriaceae bacterium]